jgi:serine/threonine protein kinase/formylglycine-generating enzyme required for sulfatase activity
MNDPQNSAPTGPWQQAKHSPPDALPEYVGRYRVERVLGQGGFGLVYLAHDDQLQRLVAIKVPHRKLVDRPEDADAYLAEARTVAALDHPHIVPVYDVGGTEDCPCFIVSKYVEGSTLAQRIRDDRPSVNESAALVATAAEALHYAHRKGMVHRDIKPGNILLDTAGQPHVADFGVALREENLGRGPKFAGTPAYMSPEQARGEGHRVDGRSDIFSLGVVLYELLVGRQPFRADSQAEVLEQVTTHEPRPLRQIEEGIPKEVERICFKALAKRASERYMTAQDMADDLRQFLAEQTVNQPSSPVARGVGPPATTGLQPPSTSVATSPSATPSTPTSDSRPVKVVPKGLRSFDEHDSDYFLELLPGPRDRDGLPDSIRFWKTRIEEHDADKTFPVGLIYGPSGCGKSSLVKAGLLPRLSDKVLVVYVEATANETEARLLNGLRKRCPALPANLGLRETLAALRRGRGIPPGKNVLIVLDQFEQWLHAKKEEHNTDLVQALRQCDGGRVQCVVLVRDDFWMAATRFMRELEIRLLEGHNSAAVDLFDLDHTKKVLAAFGRAFGKLPENSGETSKEQKEFLNQAVSGLAQEGRAICVRLALFAEMMKGKPWTPASLRAVGGTAGVGVAFLEETFSAATAPPEHRYHQKAARADLKMLLPDIGSEIKGHMRSYAELLEASGYGNRPKDFDDLIRILDNEIRLITPTDPEGKEEGSASSSKPGQKYYQLTHDYLVHSIREWLTRKQKETRRGRAELLLADRAGVWNARPENRQLPSLVQWLQIEWLTQRKHWTPPQRKMMGKASRYHAVRGLALGLLLAVATVTGLAIREQVVEQHKATEAAGLVKRLLDADTAQVPAIIGEMAEYRKWTDPLLREEKDRAANSSQQLHTSLALLPVDATQVDYLYGRLLEAKPGEVPVIRNALVPYQERLVAKLWAVAEAPEKRKESQRLRAAAALAQYDPENGRWAKVQQAVADDLLNVPGGYLGAWMNLLRPVRLQLLAPLSVVFGSSTRRETERSLAMDVLTDYAADRPKVLAGVVMDADERQFAALLPLLKARGAAGVPVLVGEIDKRLPADVPSSDERREKLAKRQVNAAAALLKMNQPARAWPVLKHGPDPRARSYLVHRLYPLGVDPASLTKRLDEEPDVTIRRALLLSLGTFTEKELPPSARTALVPKLQALYQADPDPGLHAAAEWLLRTWQQEAWLKKVNEAWAKDQEQRQKRLHGIEQALAKDKEKAPPQWYVNGQGHSMVVIPGPVEFVMGSPPTEKGRRDNETQHQKRINRIFALAAKSVTVEQYRRFQKNYGHAAVYTRLPDLPVVGINWYMAAAYCNWLSEQEGIPEAEWCYETKPPGKTGPMVQVVKLREKYLRLQGYRLPTEAEIEFATRAGAHTSRYFGETEELLPQYAWYLKNSDEKPWPVGRLKPNDFGLFDIQGNVFNWCQESYKGYPQGGKLAEDKEDGLMIVSTSLRALRGGSFNVPASLVRSALRNVLAPATLYDFNGFRPARTLPPGTFTALPPTPEGGRK